MPLCIGATHGRARAVVVRAGRLVTAASDARGCLMRLVCFDTILEGGMAARFHRLRLRRAAAYSGAWLLLGQVVCAPDEDTNRPTDASSEAVQRDAALDQRTDETSTVGRDDAPSGS